MTPMSRSLITLLIAWSLAAPVSLAQQLPVLHYTIRDGLVQMQCTAILKDSRGYVWVGTKNGLSKFDGERFDNFTTRNGLLANHIDNLIEDSKSYIWISNVRGAVRFDGKTFTPFKLTDSTMTLAGLWLGPDGMPLVKVNTKQGEQLMQLQQGRFMPIISTVLDPQQGNTQTILFVDSTHRRVCVGMERQGKGGQLWWYQNGKLSPWEEGDNGSSGWTYRGQMADGTPIISGLDTKTRKLRTYYFVQHDRLIPFFRTNDNTYTTLRAVPADCLVEMDKRYFLLKKNSTRLLPLPLPATKLWQHQMDQDGLWCATDKGLYRVWNNGFRYFTE